VNKNTSVTAMTHGTARE